MFENNLRDLIPRVLIGIVFVLNVQCALAFLFVPSAYMHGFGLEGIVGEQMVRALGLLFLMWNVPYAFALVNPTANTTALIEAVIMQGIGLLGESGIIIFGGPYPAIINATITRFIFFDGGGFVLLVIALVLVLKRKRKLTAAR